jgi:predicted GIY-YIG superfamily endonuclease
MNISKSFGLKKCGIYCITNIVNNKIYIGSSKNIYHRLKRHYSELKRGTHANKYLQNSYLKHGSFNFKVSIIEETTIDNLQKLEQYYIDTLKPDYNITIEVIRNTPSLESRLKISNTLKEQKRLGTLKYPTHDDKKKPVVIYDLNCNCIGNYESERSAAKQLEILYPGLKNSQSVVNSSVNLKGRRKVSRYKKHFLLRPENKCHTLKELYDKKTYKRQYSS